MPNFDIIADFTLNLAKSHILRRNRHISAQILDFCLYKAIYEVYNLYKVWKRKLRVAALYREKMDDAGAKLSYGHEAQNGVISPKIHKTDPSQAEGGAFTDMNTDIT